MCCDVAGPGALCERHLVWGSSTREIQISKFKIQVSQRSPKLCNHGFSWQGLAYSVSGGWNTTPVDHAGLFTAGAETAAPDKLLAALRTALEVRNEGKRGDGH